MTGFWNEREVSLTGVKATPHNRYYHIATEVWQQAAATPSSSSSSSPISNVFKYEAAATGAGAGAGAGDKEVTGDGNHYAVCDGTGEDPTCSDSIGVMKWTIADHQHYTKFLIFSCEAVPGGEGDLRASPLAHASVDTAGVVMGLCWVLFAVTTVMFVRRVRRDAAMDGTSKRLYNIQYSVFSVGKYVLEYTET